MLLKNVKKLNVFKLIFPKRFFPRDIKSIYNNKITNKTKISDEIKNDLQDKNICFQIQMKILIVLIITRKQTK